MYHHTSMHAVEARSRYIQNTFMIHLKTRGPLVLHPHSCVMMYFARRYHAALLIRRNTLITTRGSLAQRGPFLLLLFFSLGAVSVRREKKEIQIV